MIKKLITYCFLVSSFYSFSQEIVVTAKADTTQIKIGEQIQYTIGVNTTKQVLFPKLKLDKLGKLEVVQEQIDTLKDRLEKKYILTSFDSGIYVLPQQEILVNTRKFLTDSLLINVATVKVDTTKQKMYPIKSIRKEPKTFDDYKHLLWWLLAILLLIAAVVYFIIRKKKAPAKKIFIAPIQEALQRLKELDEKDLVKQHKIKAYYSELTDIVRTYIEKDINIPALESTTNELIETLTDFNESSKMGISKETIIALEKLLQGADLVKFAKFTPIEPEIQSDRKQVEQLLTNTQEAIKKYKEATQEETPLEELIENASEETSIIKKFLKNRLLVYLLIAFAVLLIGYISYSFFFSTTSEKRNEKILQNTDWITKAYGNPAVTIETPGELLTEAIQIPADLATSIEDITSFKRGDLASDFYVEITTTTFLNELSNFNYTEAIQAAFTQFASNDGARFSNLQEEIRINNGVEGRIITANYTIESSSFQNQQNVITVLLFSNKNVIRQITIAHEEGSIKAAEETNRIVQSINLTP